MRITPQCTAPDCVTAPVAQCLFQTSGSCCRTARLCPAPLGFVPSKPPVGSVDVRCPRSTGTLLFSRVRQSSRVTSLQTLGTLAVRTFLATRILTRTVSPRCLLRVSVSRSLTITRWRSLRFQFSQSFLPDVPHRPSQERKVQGWHGEIKFLCSVKFITLVLLPYYSFVTFSDDSPDTETLHLRGAHAQSWSFTARLSLESSPWHHVHMYLLSP